MKNPMEGKIAKIIFDSGLTFRIDFLPENKLRWTSIREEDYGISDVETTHVEVLQDGIIAIDWIEKDGLCVSYSVDVNAQFVKSYMSWSDENGIRGKRSYLTHEGPFTFINEDGQPDHRPFTNLDKARDFFIKDSKTKNEKIKFINVDKNVVFIETEANNLYKLSVGNDKVIEIKKFG